MVLARSKLDATDMEPIPLHDVAQSAWSNTVVDDLDLVMPSSLGTIRGNASLLTQLFENLFRNAIDHGDENITVHVGLLDGGGFFVEDNGPGIPPEYREDAFRHGFTTSPDGTGMGLSIVREIATAHGWNADIVDAEAGGARFEFRSTPSARRS